MPAAVVMIWFWFHLLHHIGLINMGTAETDTAQYIKFESTYNHHMAGSHWPRQKQQH